MKKQPILLESFIVDATIVEERVVNEAKGDIELDVKTMWQRSGVKEDGRLAKNANNRYYPEALLKREIDKINERIKTGNTVWGHPFHPKDGQGKSDDISHLWTKVWMNDSGICEGNLTILPTTSGKNIQTLVKAGKLGLSSRGFGTVTQKEEKVDDGTEKYLEVNDDFKLTTPGDWVPAPSVVGAGNLSEQISILESELNEGLDLINDKKENSKENKMNMKEFREKYPELVKQVEDEKEAALKLEAEKNKTIENENSETLKTQIAEKDTKIKELEDRQEKAIVGVRELISSASEIEGVIPDDDELGENVPEDKKTEAAIAKVQKELDEAKGKISVFEKEKTDREEKEKTEAAAIKLQSELRTKFDTVLKKDEYKTYSGLIEKELVVGGKINIDSVDLVEEKIKVAFEKINEIRSAKMKGEILATGTEEKGNIADAENVGDVDSGKKLHEEFKKNYVEAQQAGFKGSLNEWKEKYPLIVKEVTERMEK